MQCQELAVVKEKRDQKAVDAALVALRKAASGSDNLMPYLLDAVRAYATLGEMCQVLRQVFGEYQATAVF